MSPTSSLPDLTAELEAAIHEQPAINTHCHQLPESAYLRFDLEALLRNSYLNWSSERWDFGRLEGKRRFLEQSRFQSAFAWLQKALQALYNVREPLNEKTWLGWSMRIAGAHRKPAWRQELLRERCRYQRLVLDAYWQPGADNDDPALYAPSYRVNAFFFGFSRRAADHDGNNPYRLYPRPFITELDEYLAWVREQVASSQAAGCVALKLPIAYDRGLDFRPVVAEQARLAFRRMALAEQDRPLPETAPSTDNAPSGSLASAETLDLDPQDARLFQDTLFFHICELAAEFRLPLQVHTGTGQGMRTRAGELRPAIERCPETHFVLLHGSYPWIEEISPLARRYPNVYPDLSMLPLFSSQATRLLLHELIEGAQADRPAWGCDTWTPEESYGARLAFQQALAGVLAEKIHAGYFGREEALEIIANILLKNPTQLYFHG
ncbi:MAG: amidohydrolase [Chloroflexi bacterium]|nr:amidohydrolase [Chloroflexota bacterium]